MARNRKKLGEILVAQGVVSQEDMDKAVGIAKGSRRRIGQALVEAGFANEEFDKVLAEASAIADADKRREHCLRLQQIMRDEGVIIQPYWRSTFRHHVAGLVNAEMHPQFEIRYQYIGFSE